MVSVPRGLPDGMDTVDEVFKDRIEAIYTWNPVDKTYDVPSVVQPYRG